MDWKDATLRLGYSLQFCHVPPLVFGIKEINLFSKEEIDSPSKQIQVLLLKQAVLIVPTHDKQRRFFSVYFLVPKKNEGFKSI